MHYLHIEPHTSIIEMLVMRVYEHLMMFWSRPGDCRGRPGDCRGTAAGHAGQGRTRPETCRGTCRDYRGMAKQMRSSDIMEEGREIFVKDGWNAV
jgi:hypothetical protein